jgi:hypothetical protein
MADHDDDLVASKTEGFKVGEKKTLEEYQQLGMYHTFSSLLFYIELHTLSRPLPRQHSVSFLCPAEPGFLYNHSPAPWIPSPPHI